MTEEQDLVIWLRDFLKDKLTVEQLQWRLEGFIKSGRSRTLSPKQRKALGDFFDWDVDMHEPKFLPRPGILGHLQDALAQIIHGEYRVSLEDVRRKAQEVERLLKHR